MEPFERAYLEFLSRDVYEPPSPEPEFLTTQLRHAWEELGPFEFGEHEFLNRIVASGDLLFHGWGELARLVDGLGDSPRLELRPLRCAERALPAAALAGLDPRSLTQAMAEFNGLEMHSAAHGVVGKGVFFFLHWKYPAPVFRQFVQVARVLLSAAGGTAVDAKLAPRLVVANARKIYERLARGAEEMPDTTRPQEPSPYRDAYSTFMQQTNYGHDFLLQEMRSAWGMLGALEYSEHLLLDRILTAGQLLYRSLSYLAIEVDGLKGRSPLTLDPVHVLASVLPPVQKFGAKQHSLMHTFWEFQEFEMHPRADGNVGDAIFFFLHWKYPKATFERFVVLSRRLLQLFEQRMGGDDRAILAALQAGRHEQLMPPLVAANADELCRLLVPPQTAAGGTSPRDPAFVGVADYSSSVGPGRNTRDVTVALSDCDPLDPEVLMRIADLIDATGELWGATDDDAKHRRIFVSNFSAIFFAYVTVTYAQDCSSVEELLSPAPLPVWLRELGFEKDALRELIVKPPDYWQVFSYLRQRTHEFPFKTIVRLAITIFKFGKAKAEELGLDFNRQQSMVHAVSQIRSQVEASPYWRMLMGEDPGNLVAEHLGTGATPPEPTPRTALEVALEALVDAHLLPAELLPQAGEAVAEELTRVLIHFNHLVPTRRDLRETFGIHAPPMGFMMALLRTDTDWLELYRKGTSDAGYRKLVVAVMRASKAAADEVGFERLRALPEVKQGAYLLDAFGRMYPEPEPVTQSAPPAPTSPPSPPLVPPTPPLRIAASKSSRAADRKAERAEQRKRARELSQRRVRAGVGIALVVGAVATAIGGWKYSTGPSYLQGRIFDRIESGRLVSPPGESAFDAFEAFASRSPSGAQQAAVAARAIAPLEALASATFESLKGGDEGSVEAWSEAERAYQWLQQLRTVDGDQARLWFARGRLQLLAGDQATASDNLNQSYRFDPNSELTLNALGRAAAQQKDYGAAADYYWRSTALDPDWVYPWVNLGAVMLATEQWALAESYLAHAATLKPERAKTYVDLGRALEGQNKLCEGLAQYREADRRAAQQSVSGIDRSLLAKRIAALAARARCP